MAKLRQHPHLYQIHTLVWLSRLSARLGRPIRLADVPDSEWDAIAKMGFDIVWLMGVWKRSAVSRQLDLENHPDQKTYEQVLPGWTPADVTGSPYAVAAYEPHAAIGSWADIDTARAKLRQRNMALFLDFVGNHTAFDHPWTHDHPEYYVQGTQEDHDKDPSGFYRVESVKGPVFIARGRDPYFPPWDDVAQLNHFSMEMRVAQMAELQKIAAHCDGVRCDMAMLQLSEIFEKIWRWRIGDAKEPEQEFWSAARAAVPDLIFLAEAYWGTEARLMELGFSYVYDKEFYDSVRDERIGDIHWRLSAPISFQSRLARFMENHDEPRAATVFANSRLIAAGTLMGTLPGMRFYLQGEELGARVHIPIELRNAIEEPPDPLRRDFFTKLFAATRQDVFHDGEWSLLSASNEGDTTAGNLFAYEWRLKTAWKLIVVNLSPRPAEGRVHLNGGIDASRNYNFVDALDGAKYVRPGSDLRQHGLFVKREAYGAHLFDITLA